MGGGAICIKAGCSKRARYGDLFVTPKKRIHCRDHKADEEFNLDAKYCSDATCTTIAIYGEKGGDMYCLAHKPEDAVTTRPVCADEECNRPPTCGFDKATHCKAHKEEGMADLVNKICSDAECEMHASYGFDGEKTKCREHAEEGMCCLHHGTCVECNKRARFGLPGGKGTHCIDHRTDMMVDVVCNICRDIECNSFAIYGMQNERASHCAVHAEPGMINMSTNLCTYEGCDVRVHPEQGTGTLCANHDTVKRRGVRVKEVKIAHFLKSEDMVWNSWNREITDIRICADVGYRPDFVFERYTHTVVLECDELQHSPKGYSCDNKRMVDIFNSYGGLPVVFIRFNPDRYKIGGKSRNQLFAQRLSALLTVLKTSLDAIPQDIFSIIRMYYDHPSRLISHSVVAFDTGEFIEKEI